MIIVSLLLAGFCRLTAAPILNCGDSIAVSSQISTSLKCPIPSLILGESKHSLIAATSSDTTASTCVHYFEEFLPALSAVRPHFVYAFNTGSIELHSMPSR